MKYLELLNRVIDEGIEEARRIYAGDEPRNVARRAGAIEGFNACRNRTPQELVELWNAAEDACVRVAKNELTFMTAETCKNTVNSYWQIRYKALQIEWVLNCVSAALKIRFVSHLPTVRAALCVQRIMERS